VPVVLVSFRLTWDLLGESNDTGLRIEQSTGILLGSKSASIGALQDLEGEPPVRERPSWVLVSELVSDRLAGDSQGPLH
jgi:hypothetical protein